MRIGIFFFFFLFIVLDPVICGGEYPQPPFKSCRLVFALATLPPRDRGYYGCSRGLKECPQGPCWVWDASAHPLPAHTAGPRTHSSVRGLRSLPALGKHAELLHSLARSCACKFSLWTHRKFCLKLACWQTSRFSAGITQAMGLNSLWTEIGIIN